MFGNSGKRILFVGLLMTALLFLLPGAAHSQSSKGDLEISPFPGASVKARHVVSFDEYLLPLGKLAKNGKFVKSKKLQGKIVQVTYTIPSDRSVLEVYTNYEQALRQAGVQILFTLDKRQEPKWSRWADMFAAATHRVSRWDQEIKYSLHYAQDARYLAAKLARAQGDVYVAICLGKGGWHNYITLQQDIIQLRPIESGLIKVTAKMLANKIDQAGHVAVYGIYFDFNKAEIKPESEPVIREIAKFLKANPAIKLYVVGHTDNMGSLEYNMKLSKARADAVVKRLVTKYGISRDRLRAFGVGPLCPVASNGTERGRAKNRRVELVKQ